MRQLWSNVSYHKLSEPYLCLSGLALNHHTLKLLSHFFFESWKIQFQHLNQHCKIKHFISRSKCKIFLAYSSKGLDHILTWCQAVHTFHIQICHFHLHIVISICILYHITTQLLVTWSFVAKWVLLLLSHYINFHCEINKTPFRWYTALTVMLLTFLSELSKGK